MSQGIGEILKRKLFIKLDTMNKMEYLCIVL